nr:hypothetical protein [Tanacetum cinerariifolium]
MMITIFTFKTIQNGWAHGIHSHTCVNEKNINDGTKVGPTVADNNPCMPLYVKLVTGEKSKKSVNFRTLITPTRNGVDVVVPIESIRAISERFANTTYGFFLGKRVTYPIFVNYVRNTWGKYGLVKSMLNSSNGLLSFQFSFMDRLDAMLENGSRFIRNNPLIVKKWHLDVNLLEKD